MTVPLGTFSRVAKSTVISEAFASTVLISVADSVPFRVVLSSTVSSANFFVGDSTLSKTSALSEFVISNVPSVGAMNLLHVAEFSFVKSTVSPANSSLIVEPLIKPAALCLYVLSNLNSSPTFKPLSFVKCPFSAVAVIVPLTNSSALSSAVA